MMTDLQMILLISSGAFLVGIYWWGKKTKEQNNISPQRLKQHGFRADTPEQEGMEVGNPRNSLDSSHRYGDNSAEKVSPPPQITAREAWERAAGTAQHSNSQRQVYTPPQPTESVMATSPQQQHNDLYLEERFALSDPVMPRNLKQPPVNSVDSSMQYRTSEEHYLGNDNLAWDRNEHQQDTDHSSYQVSYDHYDYQNHQTHSEYHNDPSHYAAEQNVDHQQGYYPDQHNQYNDYQQHDPYYDHGHDAALDDYNDYPQETELPSQIFALLVIDPLRSFQRRDIHQAMLGAGLVFASNGIYVFYDKAVGNEINYIFRVANINETGYFTDPDDQPEEFSTTGVALILEIPNVVTPYRAMNEFITAARRISQNLKGNLYDANRRLIRESHLREMREYAQSIT